jgi:sulfofructose kinase
VSGVLIAPDGERHIFAYHGEGLPDGAEWLPSDALDTADAVLLDGRWPVGAVRVAEAARRHGLPVVFDLDGETATAMRLARLSTHVIADEEAARAAGGVERLLRELTELGVWGAVTLGAAGVVHAAGRVRGFRVTARDTTGAGDVFHAAFALALAEGQAEDAALVFASAAAAQRCALGDVPRRSDVAPLCEAPRPRE